MSASVRSDSCTSGRGQSRPARAYRSSGFKRRSKPEIYFTIVSLVKAAPLPLTKLSGQADLNFGRAKEAVGYLISQGLVDREVVDNLVCYVATMRGYEFVSAFDRALCFVP